MSFFKNFLLFSAMLSVSGYGCSKSCTSKIEGYNVLKNSVYPFLVNAKKACFFAFHIKNPAPFSDARGNGNLGSSLWYGYYLLNKPFLIHQFPKPKDHSWNSICELNAVSFRPMFNDIERDVTIIGACDKQNLISYTFPLIFKWQKNKFVLDEDTYNSLYGMVALNVDDIKQYIKSPEMQYDYLSTRYEPDN